HPFLAQARHTPRGCPQGLGSPVHDGGEGSERPRGERNPCLAQEHGPFAVMTAEESLANTLLARLGISPPVPVEQMVRVYADIEDDDLPANSDAIILRPAIGRPRIFLDRRKHPVRKRFTLAHELGHLLIPWHI